MKRNKIKQIVSIFLVVAIVLGGIISAFAFDEGIYSNQDGNVLMSQSSESDNIEKITKLLEEEYVVGYEDGTLGLDKNITRAELATILVRALDLEELAMTMNNIPSGFEDVSQFEWYNPYIIMAVSKGLVKGYPDGRFMPESNINYQEAVTMMVRAAVTTPQKINNIEMSGSYPTNYWFKASELGLLTGLDIRNMEEVSQRGNVFVILYNTIEHLRNKNSETLDVLITDVDSEEVGAIALRDLGDIKKGNTVNFVKKAGLDVVPGVYSIKFNPDKEILSIEAIEDIKTVKDKAIKVGNNRLKIDGKEYKVEDILSINHNNEDITFRNLPRETDYATATIYNGKIIRLTTFSFDDVLVVENIRKNRISVVNKEGSISSLSVGKDDSFSLFSQGKTTPIELEDIEIGDILYVERNRRQTDYLVTKNIVEGKIEEYSKETLTIDGKDYKVLGGKNPTILVQDRKYIPLTNPNNLEVFKDIKVKMSIDLNGSIKLIEIDKDALITVRALVKEKDDDTGRLTVLTENDYEDEFYVTRYTELISSRRGDYYNDRYNLERIMERVEVGDIVNVLVDNRGEIEEIEIIYGEKAIITYMDEDVLEVNRRDYDLSENVVLFENIRGFLRIGDLDELIDNFYDFRNFSIEATIFEVDREVQAIVIKILDGNLRDDLLESIKESRELIEIIGKYKDIIDEQNVSEIESFIREVEKDFNRLSIEEIEKAHEKLEGMMESLAVELIDEMVSELESRLAEVRDGDRPYNKEALEELEKLVNELQGKTPVENQEVK